MRQELIGSFSHDQLIMLHAGVHTYYEQIMMRVYTARVGVLMLLLHII